MSGRLSITASDLAELHRRRQQGASVQELREWYRHQVGGTTVSKRSISRWLARGSSPSTKDTTAKPAAAAQAPTPAEQVALDRTLVAARAERDYFKRLYQQAIKDAAATDQLVRAAREVTTAIPAVKVLYQPPTTNARTPQSVVSPLCDTHIGEEVDLEQMGGLNAYNIDIFNRRLYGWATQVVNLVELRRHYVDIPQLYVPMLGDMVSGEIHLELLRTNADNMMGQMIRGAHLIAQALSRISQFFEAVHVPCVVGNHGRMSVKPPAKDKYVDWDYLLFQWVAAFCREQKNIQFTIPKSFLHVFSVANRNILIMHGDSIRMWQSIPYYGLTRAIAQLRQSLQFRRGLEEDVMKLSRKGGSPEEFLSLLASYFDSVMLGHFHRLDELDIGTGEAHICGCTKGGDEYSFARLHTLSRPKQIVTYWHPKYGYISKDIIYLDRYDDAKETFVDTLSSVWAETEVR